MNNRRIPGTGQVFEFEAVGDTARKAGSYGIGRVVGVSLFVQWAPEWKGAFQGCLPLENALFRVTGPGGGT